LKWRVEPKMVGYRRDPLSVIDGGGTWAEGWAQDVIR
jgi:hypothetical protein